MSSNRQVDPDSLRTRLRSGERLLGTFIKTPSVHAIEILGLLGFDVAVIDQEHAPFDRQTIDQLALAGRAAGIAVLVRVPTGEARDVLPVLDCGAQGVVVPHVHGADVARAAVAEAHYGSGKGGAGRRGYSNSPRAGRYGLATLGAHVAERDALTTVIAMVEDLAALDVLGDIAAVPGLDALFIGRGDLAAAMGAASTGAPEVAAVTERIAAVGRAAGKALCAHVDRLDSPEAAWLAGLGVTLFIVASDQALMRRAAVDVLTHFKQFAVPLAPL